jgi:hypothetical protein
MRLLFDVSVLIALHDPSHVHHERSHEFWNRKAAEGWASCPITENGFVRVMSQPRYPNAISTADAALRLREATLTTDHEFWPDDLSLLDDAVLDVGRLLGPNQVTDAYLLALAVKNGGCLATLDRSITSASAIGASPANLVAL